MSDVELFFTSRKGNYEINRAKQKLVQGVPSQPQILPHNMSKVKVLGKLVSSHRILDLGWIGI